MFLPNCLEFLSDDREPRSRHVLRRRRRSSLEKLIERHLLAGPSTQNSDRQITFDPAEVAPITVGQSSAVEVDLLATDSDGGIPEFRLAAGSPGFIQPETGQFRWTPRLGDIGTHQITVIAESTTEVSNSLSFSVQVIAGVSVLDGFSATPVSIESNGFTSLALTAQRTVPGDGPVPDVEFWRDADRNGEFDPERDAYLGSDQQGSNIAEWSGRVGQLPAGEQMFFARTFSRSLEDTFVGTPLAASVMVTESPPPPFQPLAESDPVSTPLNLDANTSVLYRRIDGQSQLVIWEQSTGPLPGQQETFFAEFNLQGDLVPGSTEQLLGRNEFIKAVDDLPDGRIALVTVGTGVEGRWLDHDGSLLAQPVELQDVVLNGDLVSAAVETRISGNELIAVVAYSQGAVNSQDVFSAAFSFDGSQTAVHQPRWQVSQGTAAGNHSPALSIQDDGAGVIIWTDGSDPFSIAMRGRRIGADGADQSPSEFEISDTEDPESDASVAMNQQGDFVVAFTFDDGSEQGVLARFYRSTPNPGDRVGEESAFEVNDFSDNPQIAIDTAINEEGWSAILWRSLGQDPGDDVVESGVYAQIYDPNGRPVGGQLQVAIDTLGDQEPVSIEIDDDADVTVTWTDPDNDDLLVRTYEINFAPELDSSVSLTVPENSVTGTVVGTLPTRDADGNSLTYSLLVDSPFEIQSQTGIITVAEDALLDFETYPTIHVTALLTDDALSPKSAIVSFPISITDTDDAPQTENVSFSLPELSAPGTIVGRVPAFDPDAGDTLDFSVDPSDAFQIDADSGYLFVADQTALDFEQGPTHELTVTIMDGEGMQATSQVNIQLTDVDESGVNVFPKIDSLPETLYYIDGQAAAPLFPESGLSDLDSTNFSGGRIRIENFLDRVADDTLRFRQIAGLSLSDSDVLGSEILLDGQSIGSIDRDGLGGNPLQITLNSNATPNQVARMLQHIVLETPDVQRPSGSRLIRLSLIDESGQSQTDSIFVTIANPSDQSGSGFQFAGNQLSNAARWDDTAAAQSSFDGGTGHDVLLVGGNGFTLDLTAIEDQRITGFESLDIRGEGSNTLVVDINEILNLSSTTNSVRIYSDSDDSIDVGAGWEPETPAMVDEVFTHAATQGDASLEIITDVLFGNPFVPLDVNLDAAVSALDALVIINRLTTIDSGNNSGQERLVAPETAQDFADFQYYDSNLDGFVSALDALLVINFLANQTGESDAEGERPEANSDARAIDLALSHWGGSRPDAPNDHDSDEFWSGIELF